MTNEEVAIRLREYARELTQSGANLYRVRAVRQAVMTVLQLQDSIEKLIATEGREAVSRIPGIGSSLAETISHYAIHGECAPRTAPIRTSAMVG